MTMPKMLCLVGAPVNDDENREYARQYGLEDLLPENPPPAGYTRSRCRNHGGAVWVSRAGLGEYTKLKTRGLPVAIICKICKTADDEGLR